MIRIETARQNVALSVDGTRSAMALSQLIQQATDDTDNRHIFVRDAIFFVRERTRGAEICKDLQRRIVGLAVCPQIGWRCWDVDALLAECAAQIRVCDTVPSRAIYARNVQVRYEDFGWIWEPLIADLRDLSRRIETSRRELYTAYQTARDAQLNSDVAAAISALGKIGFRFAKIPSEAEIGEMIEKLHRTLEPGAK